MDFNILSAIQFKVDEIGLLFAAMTVIVLVCAWIFSLEYMKHDEKRARYYLFYALVFLVLLALSFAGNLITYYLFFELLTLTSFVFVIQTETREAVMAALKYLFYSLAGAYMALFGLYFVNKYGNSLTFQAGGVFESGILVEKAPLLLAVSFVMILGFSVKGGMFPMHAWLPAAHPVAPGPASAVLSAVIVKAGVLGIIRTIYFVFGADLIRGSWVQTAFMVLALITVFMGSLLAYREPVLKKRLAYSTVSQVSYILFGLACMGEKSVTGGLLHVLAHAFIKAALFLCAGAIIHQTGKTKVSQLRGIGKEMPLLMWCYTICSLGLIGIPPTSGFISKWYLAVGALQTQIPVFSVLGPAILLVSALLTAGYLLTLTITGFFPGADYDYQKLQKKEPGLLMNVPILILTILTVYLGVFPGQLISFIEQLVANFI